MITVPDDKIDDDEEERQGTGEPRRADRRKQIHVAQNTINRELCPVFTSHLTHKAFCKRLA